MARPPSAESVLKNMKRKPELKTPIADDMFLPNHSGIGVHPEFKEALGGYLPLSGGTLTGNLVLDEGARIVDDKTLKFGTIHQTTGDVEFTYDSTNDKLILRRGNGAGTAFDEFTIEDANLYCDKPLLLSDGAGTAPAFAFKSDPDTGYYLSSAAQLRVQISGATVVRYTANAVGGPNGLEAAPVYQSRFDTNTGIYWAPPDVIGISCGGSAVQKWTTTGSLFVNHLLMGTDNSYNLGSQTAKVKEIFAYHTQTQPSRALDTVYQNTTGHPIIVYGDIQTSASDTENAFVVLYSDSSNPPTTARQKVGNVAQIGGGTLTQLANRSFYMVVADDDYYKITKTTGGSGTVTLGNWNEVNF